METRDKILSKRITKTGNMGGWKTIGKLGPIEVGNYPNSNKSVLTMQLVSGTNRYSIAVAENAADIADWQEWAKRIIDSLLKAADADLRELILDIGLLQTLQNEVGKPTPVTQ